ncbi:mitochondrial branched-chain alpha-ketoacid dehydrogenase kinase-domain-containing protein [Dissophora ornata]|nr:mitochondrial branched-chain alpha-ketoacid dehydrogenase kinase-domain-containing protein [Dissophora ornata]
MNRTQAALHALPSDLINKLCRSKVTRLSLKQMYTLGRHVLESKNQGALVIPAVFLHQELPIRLSHALKMLNSNMLPVNMADMPNFQHIARSYLEDISMVTQMPKPSTPQLQEEFTVLLRNLEQRHKIKILAISRGFRELLDKVQSECTQQDPGTNQLFYHNGKGWTIEPEADKAIQTFFNRFYTINLGTRLLIGEHLALHDRGLNLVQRVNPLSISKSAIRDAQKVCAAHYGQAAPSVLIHTPNPDISTTYVEEFLHRNIYELLKNAMRATSETHLKNGSPVSLGLSSASSETTSKSNLPPIKLVLVDGGEDVTIKISDEGGGMALSQMDKIWSYVHSGDSSDLRQPLSATRQVAPKITSTTTPFQPSSPNTSTLHTSKVSEPETNSRKVLQPADSMTVMGGLASEAKDYLDLPLSGSGHGLPLARLIARYFGGDLSLISMEGYGTDSYLSLYRDDDHLENFPEVDEEMEAEVDVFVNDLLVEPSSARGSSSYLESPGHRTPASNSTSTSKTEDKSASAL